jgi:3-oxoacyl-[acyl-carrier protein] reductase
MHNKVAIIPGGAKGIGRDIALSLADAGWFIALCYRNSQKEAEETCQNIKSKGTQSIALNYDISDPNAAQDFVEFVENKWGRIDALINCAGPYHRIGLLEETVEGWNEMFDNNLHSLFYLCKAVSTGMIKREYGRIIAFSMANADKLSAQPNITAHYIAKSGIIILVRSFAKTLAKYNITVNTISPGFIDSGNSYQKDLENITRRIPSGYIGANTDVVSLVNYLISDNAKYINGANIQISGAWGI